jgi:hypothetical protein
VFVSSRPHLTTNSKLDTKSRLDTPVGFQHHQQHLKCSIHCGFSFPAMSVPLRDARLTSSDWVPSSSLATTHSLETHSLETYSLEQAFANLSISNSELGHTPVTVDASTSTEPTLSRRIACRYGAPLRTTELRDDRPAGNLRPSAVDCKWWKQGYCARGASCYFRHDPRVAGLEVRKRASGYQQKGYEGTVQIASSQQGESTDHPPGIGALSSHPVQGLKSETYRILCLLVTKV